jgi:uncharacterized protein YbjT (DUF2867 family)
LSPPYRTSPKRSFDRLSSDLMSDDRLILLTGGTGYVGGRLLRVLEEKKAPVRCLVRNPEHIASRISAPTEVVFGDVLDEASLQRALQGVHAAYYLVHSMGAKKGFVEQDRRAARLFGAVAKRCAVSRIIYLGGLGRGEDLSDHLHSRQEVGQILRTSGVPTIEFRASIILGSGSLSFELIRVMVERVPVIVTPKWVRTKTQPISIEDVLQYLVEALKIPAEHHKTYEIGGPDVVSYQDLLHEYARQRGLRRWILPVPVLTPRISSLWLGLITPVFARIGRKLVDGLQNRTVVEDPRALKEFPVRPKSVKEAMSRALINEDMEYAETRWVDALSSKGMLRRMDLSKLGPRIVSQLVAQAACSAETVFRMIQKIGGDHGWYFADFLWRLRGFLDLLVGGVGMRRGRPHPVELHKGDPIDLWRVEDIQPGKLLRLRSEMKLPGRAWLQFEVQGDKGRSQVLQTAIFDPIGVTGLLYWYALFPLHWLVFRGMLRRIARAAESEKEA